MQQQEFAGLVDLAGLEQFLQQQLPGPRRKLSVERLRAGYSNETFYVDYGEHRWVLRRPPRGELLPTSHDVLREQRTLSALAGSFARAPRVIASCDDARVIGAPFYLMERVEGIVIREQSPPQFESLGERRRIGEELIDVLVELHALDWRGLPLRPPSDPGGFLRRQLGRWKDQLDRTLPHTRPLPGLREATNWLERNLPSSATTALVHGDYKLDNVILDANPPARILALLDWEMSTVGNPLTDLAWCLAYWGPTGDPPDQMWPSTNVVTMQAGYASRAELVARYEERAAHPVHAFQFYFCFAVWRQAIICEGLYRHFLEGTAPNPKTGDMAWVVPQTVERLHRIIDGEF